MTCKWIHRPPWLLSPLSTSSLSPFELLKMYFFISSKLRSMRQVSRLSVSYPLYQRIQFFLWYNWYNQKEVGTRLLRLDPVRKIRRGGKRENILRSEKSSEIRKSWEKMYFSPLHWRSTMFPFESWIAVGITTSIKEFWNSNQLVLNVDETKRGTNSDRQSLFNNPSTIRHTEITSISVSLYF